MHTHTRTHAHTIKIIAYQQFDTSSQHQGPTEQILRGYSRAAQKLHSDRVARRGFYSTDQHPPQDPLQTLFTGFNKQNKDIII